jgi:hypothetical protein
MCSRTDSSSRLMWWCWVSLARLRISAQTALQVVHVDLGPARDHGLLDVDLGAHEVAADLRQLVQLLGGQLDLLVFQQAAHQLGARIFGSSPGSAFLAGSSMRDLISISMAAISRYSAASSRFCLRICSTYSRYCAVTCASGMSRMLKFCLRIR